MIKAVIFDMDGLLIDSEPFWQKTEKQIMAELGINITTEMQEATFGLRTDEQLHFWHQKFPWSDPDFKAMGEKYENIILDFFKNEAVLMDGADYILNFFKEKKIITALASSSSMELINGFIDKFDLRNYFQILNSAETEKYGKPHPSVYLETAKKLKTSPTECLAFEDSLHGVIAAKAAKMKVVAVPPNHKFEMEEYSIANLKINSLHDFTDNEYNKLLKQ